MKISKQSAGVSECDIALIHVIIHESGRCDKGIMIHNPLMSRSFIDILNKAKK
jgi:hypothetical protein